MPNMHMYNYNGFSNTLYVLCVHEHGQHFASAMATDMAICVILQMINQASSMLAIDAHRL